MDVESRDGWTFLRLSFLLIIPDNEQTVLPAPRTLIRYARSAHFHRRKILKISFPIFLLFFFLFILPTASNMNEVEGNSVMCVTGGFFYFIFSTFFVRENGRRVFRFSTVHRIHIPLDWDGVWLSGLHGLDCISSTRMLDFVPFDVCEVRRDPSSFFFFYLLELLDGSPIVCGMGCEHVICL